jgi:outer membrane receptor for ferric coprogen and ferric-rhodotorulic acid
VAIAQDGFLFRGKLVDATGAPIAGAQVATTTNGRTAGLSELRARRRERGQVAPHDDGVYTMSLWNRYRFAARVGAGLGVTCRSDMFAVIDNTVTLPSYVRADAAAFFSLTSKIRLQANIEKLFNAKYYGNADSNTNISPGSPRALRVALTTRF